MQVMERKSCLSGPVGVPRVLLCPVLVPRCVPSTCPHVTAALCEVPHSAAGSQWLGSISSSWGWCCPTFSWLLPGESSASVQRSCCHGEDESAQR